MEIEEETSGSTSLATPLLPPKQNQRVRKVLTKIPEIQVNVYLKGKGPIDVIKCSLVGWDQNQVEVRQILEKYDFKCIYAFNTRLGRGARIRSNPQNGRSIITYKDGAVIHVDGEPKGSLIKPITRILVMVSAMTILIVLAMKDTPQWVKNLNLSGVPITPWIIACAVIVFTRMRNRPRNLLEKKHR